MPSYTQTLLLEHVHPKMKISTSLKLVCPLAILSTHILLLVYFFKLLIPFICSLDKCHTRAFNALIGDKLKNFRPVQIENICKQCLKCFSSLKFVLNRIENIVGKGENACHKHFLLFPQCFPKFVV